MKFFWLISFLFSLAFSNSSPTQEVEVHFDYQTIALSIFTLVILVFLLFILKKSQKKELQNDKNLVEQQKSPKEIEVVDTEVIEEDEIDFNELNGQEEGCFDVIENEEELQDDVQELQKRTLAIHGKIAKKDFKEFAGARILIAEDNIINQKVLLGLLGDSGIELVLANNGKEALDILENDKNFTLILMDAHMPILDGFEATRKIRENPEYNHIAIVALSGDTSDSDIKKMLNAGMDEHLEKPLRMDALYDVLYVYTDYNKEDDADKTSANSELNIEKGLSACSGDEQFYHEILDEFLMAYADSDTKIFEYINEDQLILANKYLLDLVGLTSQIGADRLNVIAKKMKEALKNEDENNYLPLAHEYSELLHKLIQSIHEYK